MVVSFRHRRIFLPSGCYPCSRAFAELCRHKSMVFMVLVVLLLQIPIQGDVLIDGQRFPTCMTSDQLKLSIRHAAVPSQPRNCLMAEGVGRSLHTGFLGVLLDDLPDPACRVFASPASLKQPTVVGMSRNVGPQGCGKALAKQNVTILAAFSQIDPDLAVL